MDVAAGSGKLDLSEVKKRVSEGIEVLAIYVRKGADCAHIQVPLDHLHRQD